MMKTLQKSNAIKLYCLCCLNIQTKQSSEYLLVVLSLLLQPLILKTAQISQYMKGQLATDDLTENFIYLINLASDVWLSPICDSTAPTPHTDSMLTLPKELKSIPFKTEWCLHLRSKMRVNLWKGWQWRRWQWKSLGPVKDSWTND